MTLADATNTTLAGLLFASGPLVQSVTDPMPDGVAAAASALGARLAAKIPAPAGGDTPARLARGFTFAYTPGYSPSATENLWQCGANNRFNRYKKAKITKQLRDDAKKIAAAERLPHITYPVTILAVQHPAPGQRTSDAENIAPLVKAAIDGLRDAGVLINDSFKYVPMVSHTVGERRPGGQLVLHFTPLDGAR